MEEKRMQIIAEFYRLINKLPSAPMIDEKCKEAFAAGEKDFCTLDYYEAIFIAANSEFLNGGGKKGWKADFQWLIKPENMLKVLTEKYSKKSDFWEWVERRFMVKLFMSDDECKAGLPKDSGYSSWTLQYRSYD